jgi:hypothetical protein
VKPPGIDQTVRVVNRRDAIDILGDSPVAPPKSAPLRLMFEMPLELRVPAKATNVGTFVRC